MTSKIIVDQIESSGSNITIPTGTGLVVTDGIAATNLSGTIADARLPTVPVTKGGTGLTSLGSANQQVRVNSAGNALEFATIAAPSSDFVKITSTVLGSATTTFNIDNIFSATYKSYMYRLNLKTSNSNHQIRFRLLKGGNGTEMSNSNYQGGTVGGELRTSGNNNSQSNYQNNSNNVPITIAGSNIGNLHNPNNYQLSIVGWVYDPFSTSNYKTSFGDYFWQGSSDSDTGIFTGKYAFRYGAENTVSSTGISFSSSTSNGIAVGTTCTVYGIKE